MNTNNYNLIFTKIFFFIFSIRTTYYCLIIPSTSLVEGNTKDVGLIPGLGRSPGETKGYQWKQCQTIFWGSRITAEGDCSHAIKRCLLLGRKVMTSLDSIFKSRDIPLSTKVHLVKAMVFPVVMYGCESWTVKKAECRRIDAFELLCWRRLLSSLASKEIQPVHPKGDQSWVFIGRTNAETETPRLWPPHVKS